MPPSKRKAVLLSKTTQNSKILETDLTSSLLRPVTKIQLNQTTTLQLVDESSLRKSVRIKQLSPLEKKREHDKFVKEREMKIRRDIMAKHNILPVPEVNATRLSHEVRFRVNTDSAERTEESQND